MTNTNLSLFYRPACPFCQKVLGFLQIQGLQIELKDISNEELKNELVEVGGKSQVPCLLIEGEPLYESDEIIEWLAQNLE